MDEEESDVEEENTDEEEEINEDEILSILNRMNLN